jgi:hypothetical protein
MEYPINNIYVLVDLLIGAGFGPCKVRCGEDEEVGAWGIF